MINESISHEISGLIYETEYKYNKMFMSNSEENNGGQIQLVNTL